ncbi:acetyltransferase [Peristeroidobacter agariperforans]|uniref:acetyltransferase n=1 Tax=Peristeroidobacter agariperforans TaxID=268404 RepID=UPI00101BFFA9|nr:acetyltransferase [Peristeroidobacter agariperforans]
MIRIRPNRPEDLPRLFEIWRTAVEATHGFVSPEHLRMIGAQVREQYLPNAVLQVAVDAEDHPMGFMGAAEGLIDSLFVDPAYHGRGVGRCLVETARTSGRTLSVDVNEQNIGARRFYERLGFKVIGRSELDTAGMPYPLLHLREQ